MATVTSQTAPVPPHELSFQANELPKLRSNYGKYVDPASIGFLRPTPVDTPIDEMRRRFEEDGYVWIKHLLPREDVLDMRQHYFEHLAPTGILKPGTSPRDGIFDTSQDPLAHHGVGGRDLPGDAAKVELLTSAHRTDIYQSFLKHPQLRAFIREFMGWQQEMMVVRNLLRHNVPQGLSTGFHYDRIFLRAGAAEFLTAWVPIGDVSVNGGGLTYLADSTALGLAMEADFMARAANFTDTERINAFNMNMMKDGQLSHDMEEMSRTFGQGVAGLGDGERKGMVNETGNGQGKERKCKWLIPSGEGYEAGDVMFHNEYMIHGAAKNEDERGVIRLSSDVRFYEEGADYDKRWMRFWEPDDKL